MTAFVSGLARKAGIDDSSAEKGLGALLSAIRIHVPADSFANLSAVIPESNSLLNTFQNSSKPTSDGASLHELAGGLLGKDAGAFGLLISQFSKAGFSLESAKSFIPIALDYLKDNISPEAMTQIDKALPGVSALLIGDRNASRNPIDSLKKLF